jgi:CHAD domain-containing protein
MVYKNNKPVEYKLIKHETLASNFLRLISGMNDVASSLCRFRAVKYSDTSIHEIRKSMKRARAVLKLFRSSIGEEIYIDENTLYREISRQLSELRISSVRVKSVNILINSHKLIGDGHFYDGLVNELQTKHNELLREMILKNKVHRSFSVILKGNKQKIKQIPDFPCEFPMLLSGLRKMYRKCTVNLNVAVNQPSAESIHNFRKSVKYLWNQMILIRPVWPPTIGQVIRYLDVLGERLGMEHDLAELEHYLWSNFYADASEIEPLILLIRKERKRIQSNVWPLSLKVFAETPGSFAKRMLAYWNVSEFNPRV